MSLINYSRKVRIIDFSDLLVINCDDSDHASQNYGENNDLDDDQPGRERALNTVVDLRVSEHGTVVRANRLDIETTL